MYTLENVTLRLNNGKEVSVIGNDRLGKVELPIRMITFMGDGFGFSVQNGNMQYYIPFKNMDTSKVVVPIDMKMQSVPDSAECPALFLYDLLAEYMCSRKGIRDFDLESIKERHGASSGVWGSVNLEQLLKEIRL